jgi:hypothetical protein
MGAGGPHVVVITKSPQGDIDAIMAQVGDYSVQVVRAAHAEAAHACPEQDTVPPPPSVRPLPACLIYRDLALQTVREARESGLGVV